MKPQLTIGFVIVSALIAGCSRQESAVAPVDKLPVASTLETGAFVAAVPADVSGKAVTEATGNDVASVDTVAGKEMTKDLRWYLKRGDQIQIGGWAYSKTSPATVYLELAGADARYYARVDDRVARADVAKFLGIEAADIGYQLTATTQNIAPASYRIAVLQVTDAGVVRWESPARVIVDEK